MPFICTTICLSTKLIVPNDDRPWTLEAGTEPFAFFSNEYNALFRGRVKSTTDGLSAPQFAQGLISRTGKYLFQAIAHDLGYHECLEQQASNGYWFAPAMRKPDWDLILRELLIDHGCPEIEAQLIYLAVSKFGESSIVNDLSLPIP